MSGHEEAVNCGKSYSFTICNHKLSEYKRHRYLFLELSSEREMEMKMLSVNPQSEAAWTLQSVKEKDSVTPRKQRAHDLEDGGWISLS